jgi:hypothetical protein
LKGETKNGHILVKTSIEFDEKIHGVLFAMLWQLVLTGMWLQHYKCFLQGAN